MKYSKDVLTMDFNYFVTSWLGMFIRYNMKITKGKVRLRKIRLKTLAPV